MPLSRRRGHCYSKTSAFKFGKVLTFDESGYKVYRYSLHCFCNFSVSLKLFFLNEPQGSRVVQLVKCLTSDFSLGCDLRVVGSSPMSSSILGMEPAWNSLFPSAPSLFACVRCSHPCSLFWGGGEGSNNDLTGVMKMF